MKLKKFLIKLINFYQKNISIFTGRNCVFYPTCSQYAVDAINEYGAIKGCRLTVVRVLRCHPWQRNHIDPV